jgi:4-nitrophenyl phosphatase
MNLSEIKAVISDMDGVLWRGDEPLPGLIEFFDFLEHKNLQYALATNNSRKTQVEYVAKLARMGVHKVHERHIMTSGIAMAVTLKTLLLPASRLYVIGGSGLRYELQKAGFVLAEERVQAVVVGIDLEFTYEKARIATRLINEGAMFVGTNADRTLPLENELAPGAGSIIALLQTSTDATPLIIGKPQRAMFDSVLQQMNVQPYETLMIGDRINTDIQGAHQVGIKTALVLTGVDSRESASRYAVQPDIIVEDLPELMRLWE